MNYNGQQEYLDRMEHYLYIDPYKCIEYCKLALAHKSDEVEPAGSLMYLAKSYRVLNNQMEAEKNIVKSLKQVSRESELKVDVLLEYAVILMHIKNYNLAYDYLQMAFDDAIRLFRNDDLVMTKLHCATGVIFGIIGNREKCLESFKKAWRYVENYHHSHLYGTLCLNMSQVYLLLEVYDEALVYAEKGYQYFVENDSPFYGTYYYDIISRIYMQLGDYESSLEFIEKGLTYSKECKIINTHTLKLTKASILEVKGCYDEAIEIYLDVKRDMGENEVGIFRESVLRGLISIYKKMNDKAKTMYYLDEFYEYSVTKSTKEQRDLLLTFNSIDEKLAIHTHTKLIKEQNRDLEKQNYKLHKMNESIKKLYVLSSTASSLGNFEKVLMNLYEMLSRIIPIDVMGVGLVNDERTQVNMYRVAYYNQKVEYNEYKEPYNETDSMIGNVLRSKKLLYLPNAEEYFGNSMNVPISGHEKENLKIQSCIYVPVAYDNITYGACYFKSRKFCAYNGEDIDLAEIIASFASVAITNVKKSRRLQEVANRDGLTGLYNRRGLESMLKNYVGQVMGTLFIDVDYFKEYNDYYGHLKGDRCLQKVAATINKIVDQGFVARYGGDEFIVVLPESSLSKVENLGKAILEGIRELKMLNEGTGEKRYLTVSIGGVAMEVSEEDNILGKMLGKADQGLYQAKQKGRNRFCL